jgi:hypothetical protein
VEVFQLDGFWILVFLLAGSGFFLDGWITIFWTLDWIWFLVFLRILVLGFRILDLIFGLSLGLDFSDFNFVLVFVFSIGFGFYTKQLVLVFGFNKQLVLVAF